MPTGFTVEQFVCDLLGHADGTAALRRDGARSAWQRAEAALARVVDVKVGNIKGEVVHGVDVFLVESKRIKIVGKGRWLAIQSIVRIIL